MAMNVTCDRCGKRIDGGALKIRTEWFSDAKDAYNPYPSPDCKHPRMKMRNMRDECVTPPELLVVKAVLCPRCGVKVAEFIAKEVA